MSKSDDEVEDLLSKLGGPGCGDLAKAANALQKVLNEVKGGLAVIRAEIAKIESSNEVLRKEIDQIRRENAAQAIEASLNFGLPLATHQPPTFLQ